MGRFRDTVLNDAALQVALPDFKKACEPRADWNPSRLEQAICYHGLGHLFTYITNADLQRALIVCKDVGQSTLDDYTRVCDGGVFMQIYQPLEPDDFSLIDQLPEKPTRKNYRSWCAHYSTNAQEKAACLQEAWPLFYKELVVGTGSAAFCAGQPNEAETAQCYEAVATMIGRLSLSKSARAIAACEQFPRDRRRICFSFLAQTVLEEDLRNAQGAVAVCQKASDETVQDGCLSDLVGRLDFNFIKGSKEKAAFCGALPERFRASCEPLAQNY